MIQAVFERLGGWQFVRFLLVGLLNTAFGYALFAGFVLLGAPSTIALAGATVLGVAFNFRTIGRLVFDNGEAGLLPRFVAVYIVYFLVNLASLKLLERLGLAPLVAQLLLLPWLSVFSFLLMRRLVFARVTSAPGSSGMDMPRAATPGRDDTR